MNRFQEAVEDEIVINKILSGILSRKVDFNTLSKCSMLLLSKEFEEFETGNINNNVFLSKILALFGE